MSTARRGEDVAGVDIGHGHTLWFAGWHPDRELNPRYAGIPGVERHVAVVDHPAPDGSPRTSAATLDSDTARRLEPGRPMWVVERWEPLTLSPSLLCTACGDHGFVRGGRWVPA